VVVCCFWISDASIFVSFLGGVKLFIIEDANSLIKSFTTFTSLENIFGTHTQSTFNFYLSASSPSSWSPCGCPLRQLHQVLRCVFWLFSFFFLSLSLNRGSYVLVEKLELLLQQPKRSVISSHPRSLDGIKLYFSTVRGSCSVSVSFFHFSYFFFFLFDFAYHMLMSRPMSLRRSRRR
jgi:hypothetical protein